MPRHRSNTFFQKKDKQQQRSAVFQQSMSEGSMLRRIDPDAAWSGFKIGSAAGFALFFLYLMACKQQAERGLRPDVHLTPLPLQSEVLPLEYARSYYTPAPAAVIPDMLQKSLNRTWDAAMDVAQKTCERIKFQGLNPFNNPPHYLYLESKNGVKVAWPDPASDKLLKLRRQYEVMRAITNTLIDNRLEALALEWNKLEDRITSYVQENVRTSGLDQSIVEQTLLQPLNEFQTYLKSLARLHVNEAVIKLTRGGLCREFTYISALEIVRALERKGIPVPSISVINLYNAHGQYTHSMISINKGRPQTIPEEDTRFCDSWLRGAQGPSFFSDPGTHPSGYAGAMIRESLEVGVHARLDDFDPVVQRNLRALRRELIHGVYEVPKAQVQELIAVRDQINELLSADYESKIASSQPLQVVEEAEYYMARPL